ncbi:MAG: hypothetical protein JJU11_11680 [Candidatus Sumerlaeia bacterium]|nr:hypothetical protein [Candidatus Sumerlaeia bacterium]
MMLPALATIIAIAGAHGPVKLTVPFELSIEHETEWGQSVFLTGDHPLLGNNNPVRAIKLSPHEYPVWSVTLDLPPGTSFQPRFILRDDNFDRLADPTNFQELEIRREHLVTGEPGAPPTFDPPPPEASPARVETFVFNPGNFSSRTIRVLLPKGYNEGTDPYPLLLAQDGQNVFHPGGPFGTWNLDQTITQLIDEGSIPPIILVGVDNTNERFAEYIPNWGSLMGTDGRGNEFLAMIRDELIPELESRYRLSAEPEDRTHLGSSLGGLLGWEAAHSFRDTFGTVAALSPSFQIETETIMTMAAEEPSARSRLYIDSGTLGSTGDGYWNTIGVRDRLIESGHAIGPDFMHRVGLNQQHNEAAWRARSPRVLLWIYNPEAFITSD